MHLISTTRYLGPNVYGSSPGVCITVQVNPNAPDFDVTSAMIETVEALRRLSSEVPLKMQNPRAITLDPAAGVFRVVVDAQHCKVAELIVNRLIPEINDKSQSKLSRFKELAREATGRLAADGITCELQSLLDLAEERRVPWFPVPDRRGWFQLGYGRNGHQLSSDCPADLQALSRKLMTSDPDGFRIPIISITGTNAKTTVTRMINHILGGARSPRTGGSYRTGMTTTDGIFIGDSCFLAGDTTGPRSARKVLSDLSVEVAILESARGGIVHSGLGYDLADVAVLTNIGLDHIGQDGIQNLHDVIRIKKVVADHIRPNGTLIINADNENLAELYRSWRRSGRATSTVLYSLKLDNALIRSSIEDGFDTYYVDGGYLTELRGGQTNRFLRAEEMDFGSMPCASFQVGNALASVAAVRALGFDLSVAARGLRTFDHRRHNKGRMNLFNLQRGHLLLDYAHNPEAIKAIGAWTRSMHFGNVTCVLGLPGDRAESLIRDAARAAAGCFDQIIIREDIDLRGRKAGEVAGIIESAIYEVRRSFSVKKILNGAEALRYAVAAMEEGDLTVFFYDDWAFLSATLSELGIGEYAV